MGGLRHAPAALTPGKTRYPLYRRLISKIKNFHPPVFRNAHHWSGLKDYVNEKFQ
jgi:sugar (pentulose or hexulose) kinase